MINMKPNLDGNGNGISETLIESKNREWMIIGGVKKWIRNCPKCNREITYSNKYKLKYSFGKLCNSCRQLLCDKNNIYERSCPLCGIIIKYKSRGSYLLSKRKNKICLHCHSKNNILSTEKFITKSNLIHKNKYDYSKSNYINNKTKLVIICKFHGEFLQTSNNHLNGKGCKKCRDENHKLTTETFVKRSIKIHNNFYDYSKFVYTDCKSKGIIICPIHGEFLQIPNSHLSGCGCIKCHFSKLTKITNSKIQNNFLDFIGIKNRNVSIGNFIVDGLFENTVYEFLGDYWHGNPEKFNPNDVNKLANKTFKELYDYTFYRFDMIKNLGYNIKYIWENDWKLYKKNKIPLNIKVI